MVVVSHWCSIVLSYDSTVKAIAYDSNHAHTHQTVLCPMYEALSLWKRPLLSGQKCFITQHWPFPVGRSVDPNRARKIAIAILLCLCWRTQALRIFRLPTCNKTHHKTAQRPSFELQLVRGNNVPDPSSLCSHSFSSPPVSHRGWPAAELSFCLILFGSTSVLIPTIATRLTQSPGLFLKIRLPSERSHQHLRKWSYSEHKIKKCLSKLLEFSRVVECYFLPLLWLNRGNQLVHCPNNSQRFHLDRSPTSSQNWLARLSNPWQWQSMPAKIKTFNLGVLYVAPFSVKGLWGLIRYSFSSELTKSRWPLLACFYLFFI